MADQDRFHAMLSVCVQACMGTCGEREAPSGVEPLITALQSVPFHLSTRLRKNDLLRIGSDRSPAVQPWRDGVLIHP